MNKITLRREQFIQSFKNLLRRVVFDGGTLEAPVYVNKLLKSIQNASILQIPVTFGLGKLYSEIGEDFDVVRGSNVWRTNEHGYYEEVKDNRPCIDYTDGFPVLLTQPQSTNFIKNSSTLSLQVINQLGIVTDNAFISPEGIQNAAIYETDGASSSYVRSYVTFTSTSATQLATFSYHVKYVDNQWVRLRLLSFNVGASVYFDVLNGVIGNNQFPLDVTPKIEPLKDGWYRISITREFDFSTDRTGVFQIAPANGDGIGSQTPGKQVALYVPQAEELGYASTPIKTGAAVVTRLADEITGAGSVNTINSEEGVLYVERANIDLITGNYISLNDGSINNRVFVYANTSGTNTEVRCGAYINNISQGTAGALENFRDFNKIALVYDSDSLRLYLNENPTPAATLTLTDTQLPNTLTELDLGTGGSNVKTWDKTKELRVYKSQEDASKDLTYIIPFDADFLQSYKNFINDIRNIGGITENKTYTDDLLKQAVNASIVNVPTSYDVGKLFNQSPNDRLEDFDVVRNSNVWRTNKGGYYENIGINVPCIDYTDGFPVLLTQPQSTNFVKNSSTLSLQTISNAGIVTDNAAISPEGIQNAAIYETDGVSNSYVRSSINFTSTSTTQLATFSYHVKYVNNQWVRLRTLLFNVENQVWFDILNGVIGTNDFPLDSTAKIEPLKDGWYRISMTREFDFSADRDGLLNLSLVDQDDRNDQTPGKQVALYEPQAEELGYATTPIKTGSSVVSRLKDEITGAGSTNTINSEEGVLLINAASLYDNDTALNRGISLSDGSAVNTIYFKYDNSKGVVQVFLIKNGSSVGFISVVGVNILDYKEFTVTWDNTNVKLYIDEVLERTNTLTDTFAPNTLTKLNLNVGSNFQNFEGKLKELRVYKSKAEAQIDVPYIT